MNKTNVVDHLFRHHYGKMVATLVRLFGLDNMEMIEDAVQDTFLKAISSWKLGPPENPEGWLTKSAKNRAIDIIRKSKAENTRANLQPSNTTVEAIEHVFLDYQIEDSQLKMIFTACHPLLDPKDQIAFALKTIAGFSNKEIAAALLLNLETVKKRLSRARKTIKEKNISFSIPIKKEMKVRLSHVHNVLYLIFNEGFHSTKSDMIIRKDLCGEAMRLISLILKKHYLRSGEGYALFGLFCFHAARLNAKLSPNNLLIDLKNQDRKLWNLELVALGNNAMHKSVEYDEVTDYHIESGIAAEHVNATSYEATNWPKILEFYQILHTNSPTSFSQLNLAFVYLQMNNPSKAKEHFDHVIPKELGNRVYLYYGVLAEYFISVKDTDNAINHLNKAIDHATNKAEKSFLVLKRDKLKK